MTSPARLIFAVLSFVVALAVGRTARAEGVLYVAHDAPATRRLFPLERTDVKADVAGDFVSTEVTQRFKNPYAERIEAVYVFPLPERAAVDAMEMHIGARVVRAEVKKRAEAQAAYDAATREGKHAALLEQERANVFTFSVANVDPGATIEVKLHYFELAKYDHGTYEMAFPMVVGPRYIPGAPLGGSPSGTGTKGDTTRVPDASRISPAYVPPGVRSGHAIGIQVRVDGGAAALESVESTTHEITTTRGGSSVATLALRDKEEIPNRDFVVRWRLAAPDVRAESFAYRPRGAAADAPGYVALLVEPKHDANDREIAPRELFFLLDSSGSMSGAPLGMAVSAVKKALVTMLPNDTFQIIDFADAASSFAPRPLGNTPENVQRALAFLDHLQASGGTNQLAGVHAALSAPATPGPARVRYVMFMTDGYIGNEAEVLALVQRELGASRIFGFGIGGSVNRYLLDEVSSVGRGYAEYMMPGERPDAMVERFYERIGRPYLTDVTVDWGQLPVRDAVPARLPDLSALEPLVVLARYQGSGEGTVTLRGRVAGRPYEQKIEVRLPAAAADHVAVGRLWARARIGELMRADYTHPRAHEDDVTRIALEHHLVSAYTSLVAIDETPVDRSAQGFPKLVNQPNDAPADVNVAAAGGTYATGGALRQRVLPVQPGSAAAGGEDEAMGDSDGDGIPDKKDVEPKTTSMAGAPPAEADVAVHRRGGCAGCATASSTDDLGAGAGSGAAAALAAFVVLLGARRRRREREDGERRGRGPRANG